MALYEQKTQGFNRSANLTIEVIGNLKRSLQNTESLISGHFE